MAKSLVYILIFSISIALNSVSETLDYTMEQPNNILQYLAQSARQITERSLEGINSLEDWRRVRDLRYAQLVEMLSLTDVSLQGERSPVNVTITGTIQQEGYRIVKLYYESLPKLYVPANLYIPDNLNSPAPAVLYVCGHSRTQKVHYQTHPRKWAQLGFVCLIIETIQWGEVLGEHWGCYARGWFNWYSRGYTPGGTEAWNAIRGLDLLCSLPEVDRERLGVTGISGGGSQSFYIAALDPRIKAAAPVCGGCALESQIGQRIMDGHCDCMTPINTYGIDYSDIGALIAPRPLLIAQADRDGLNPIEAARTIAEKIQKIYDFYQAGDRFAFVETPGPHSYHEISRTNIFSFFIKHLMGKEIPPDQVGDIDESGKTLLSEDELRAYVNGPPADDRTKTIQNSFQVMATPPQINTVEQLKDYRAKVVAFLKEKTFAAFPQNPPDLDVRLFARSREDEGGMAVYSFLSEEGYRLKVDCRQPEDQLEKKPALLVLRSPGEKRWESEGFASGLSDEWSRAFFEARGIGETSWGPELQWHIRRAAAWTGRTVASMRVWDVLRCLQALRSLPNIDSQKIAIAARDEMTAIALYAALMDGGVDTVYIKNPPPTQNAGGSEDGRGEAIEMLNCLRVADLPQIAGILCPTKLVFIGKPDAKYEWAFATYKTAGGEEKVRIELDQ